jgi:hypothetical protein
VYAAKRKPRRLEHSLFPESTMDIDRERVVCTSSYCTWMGAPPHSNVMSVNLSGEMKVALSLGTIFAVKCLFLLSYDRMLWQNV